METIGVTAIIEGLSTFISGMDKIQASIEKIQPPASILQDAFGMLGEAAGNFASFVGDVLTYTLGGLLKDAIEGVISAIGEMITKTIEAGNNFQALEIRLNGLNLETLVKSGMDYNEATKQSIELTKEQLSWLQLLAAQTPYDNADISNIYTLARGYGFADEESKKLTETVVDFTAGMGLSSQTMERVIVNLGQMEARGKITGRELADLARGSMLPLNDVLQIMVDELNASGAGFVDNSAAIAKNSGKLEELKAKLAIAIQKQKEFTDKTKESTRMANELTINKLREQIDGTTASITNLGNAAPKLMTVADLMKKISEPGAGVDPDLFVRAFEKLVETSPRFINAGERMARTWKAATDNVKDLATSFGGLDIVAPILDVLGAKVADFMDQFSKSDESGRHFTELGQRLLDASIKIGNALADIVSSVLGLAPSTSDLANSLVEGLESTGSWLTTHKGEIVDGIKSIFDKGKEFWDWLMSLGTPATFQEGGILTNLRDLYNQLFLVNEQTKTNGFQDLLAAVKDVGSAIGEVLKPVLADLGVVIDGNKPTLKDFTDALLAIGQWIRDNRETLQLLLQFFIAFVIVQTATNLIWTFIGGLIATGAAILTVLVATGALVIIIGTVIAIVAAVIVIWKLAQVQMQLFTIAVQTGVDLIKGYFTNMENTIRSILTRIDTAWRNGDWIGIGWAIISGIADGIGRNVGLVIDAARDAAWAAYQAALAALGISSPSKLFAGIGENVMAGMAQGITDSMGVAVGAMNNAVAAVTMPALTAPAVTQQYMSAAPSSISNTYQSNNSYNLSIHSQAQTEQVGSDFALMQSLAGI